MKKPGIPYIQKTLVLIFFLLLFFSPLCLFPCHAQPITWNFRKKDSAQKWKITGAKVVRLTGRGLTILGNDFIRLLAPEDLLMEAGKYQLLEVRVRASSVLARMGVTWTRKGAKSSPRREVVRVLENTGQMQTVRINLGRYPEWSGPIQQFLLGFYSRGGKVELESVKIWRPTFLRTLHFAWDEFSRPEYFKPLSINAIHGPNLFGRKWLSWNDFLIFSCMLLFACAGFVKKGRPLKNILAPGGFRGVLCLILLLWIVFDLRFSYDMAQSLRNVYTRAFSGSGEKPASYILGDFFEFVRFCDQRLPPLVPVNFFAPSEIFFPRFKYFMAPRKASYDGDRGDWFVAFHDTGLFIEEGSLIRRSRGGRRVMAPKGRVIGRFSGDSFIYHKES